MKCPKCGYLRQSRDDAFAPPTECPACGIVYAKYGPGSDAAENPLGLPLSAKKQSAVDESTLRKARERVERRLRKKTDNSTQDDQRERLLKRARILAAEGVRKRQQEWQQRQANEGGAASLEEVILLQEPAHPQAINILADQLLPPETVPAEPPAGSLVDAAMEETLTQPSPELEDTISEEPLLVNAAEPTQMAAASEIETLSQAPTEEEPAMEQSNVIAMCARAVQPQESLTEGSLRNHSGDQAEMQPEQLEADPPFPKVKIGGLMRFFQAVAWLILITGVGGAVLSWITLTDVQANPQALGPMNSGNLSMALLLGFAYLAIGVLGFAFFWVTSLIGGQLAEIRKILLQGSQAV